MKTFDFFLDQKVTTWMRTDFSIEANNLNEAVKIAKEKLERGDLDEISWDEVEGVKEVLHLLFLLNHLTIRALWNIVWQVLFNLWFVILKHV